MTHGLRDYVAWHADYDDPESPLSWRLRVVQEAIDAALDASTGHVRIISACAGDGRDVLGVLSRRTDAGRVRAGQQDDEGQRNNDPGTSERLFHGQGVDPKS